jgi:hypothetical protein
VVDGEVAYLLTKRDGVVVLDISERRAKLISKFRVENFTSLLKEGDKLYVSNQYKGLYILDVSNPETPKFVSRTLTQANRVVKSANSLYISNSKLGTVEQIDEVGSAITKYIEVSMISDVEIDGEYLYTLNLKNELEIFQNDETVFKSGETIFSVNLIAGWNLLGNPLAGEFSTEGLNGTIYTFENQEWAKNPISISSNSGFWVYSDTATKVKFIGTPKAVDFTNLKVGWNLLGSGKKVENLEKTYIYNQKWIYNPVEISPAQGFWFYK